MLKHFYQQFCKAKYASLAAKISAAAREGDKLSQKLFEDAGYALGRFISSLSSKIAPVKLDQVLLFHFMCITDLLVCTCIHCTS